MPPGKSNDRIVTDINKLSSEIIGAAIEVHKVLGPGLLESAYEQCLCHELNLRGISYKSQEPLAVRYKGIKLDCGYRLDIVVEDKIILSNGSYCFPSFLSVRVFNGKQEKI